MNYLAVGGNVDHYDMLREPAVGHFGRLQKHLAASWNNAGADKRGFMEAAVGCLAKLSSTLLETKRLSDHHEALIRLGEVNRHSLSSRPDASLCLQGAEACTDFENLLLQGRATLDRLTYFLDFQLFPKRKDRCDRFSALPAHVEEAAKRDGRGTEIANHLASVLWLHEFFSGLDKRTLRAYVAHRLAAVEWLDSCFSIVALDADHLLVFDAIVNTHPVFGTTWRLSQEISYFVLSTLAVFTTRELLPLDACAPTWKNDALVFTDWLSSESTPIWRVIARRMKPGGFDATGAYIREDVRARAIAFQSPS